MAQPYPIPREARDAAANVGSGVATYGPFGFKIFDVDDVKVYTRPVEGGNWALASVTVTKTTGAALDTFSITFPSPITNATQYKVLGARVSERSAGITSGTRLNPDALEKELSKFAATLQELRRDVDRGVQVQFGDGYSVSDDLADGDTLMKSGSSLVPGPNSGEISNAQGYAEAAGLSALAAGNSAGAASTAAGAAADARDLAQQWANNPEDSVVAGGLYSAFHWAKKAAQVVLDGLVDLSVTTAKIANGAVTQAKLASSFVSGWSSKGTLADADTFLIGDSAASGVAKVSTLANTISSIFNGTRAIANGIFLAATFAWQNAGGFKRTHNITGHTADRATNWPDGPVTIPSGTLITGADVAANTATIAAGAVGSKAQAYRNAAVAFGGTTAGSNLTVCNNGSGTDSTTLTGTWRCLGVALAGSTVGTMWLRIS